MANRRNLKKSINYIASELFTECMVNKLYIPNTDAQKADDLMGRILKMQDEFLSRVSHAEPGNTKGFFKKLNADLQLEINSIIEEIGKLN